MSNVFKRVRSLVGRGQYEVSLHGFRELAADNILLDHVVTGIETAIVLEEYPGFHRGPSVLVLQRDPEENPVHVLWGIPKDRASPAVIITAYRPDPRRWSADFRTRRKT